MARRSPLVARRRGVVAGALAIALTAASVPALAGCKAVPYMVHTLVSWCLPILSRVFDDPLSALPHGYAPCGRHTWSVRGEEIKFCLYCSPDPAQPVLVQLNCAGDFYPMRFRDHATRPPTGAPGTGDRAGPIKMPCDEYIVSIAQAATDEFRSRADASIIAPNRRALPSADSYDDLEIQVDGLPLRPDGILEIESGSALRIRGAFEQVARYAAEVGVRSIEFRDGNTSWAIEVNHEFSAIAIFRNGRLAETRFLFAPNA